jgi:hypothetical protein
MRGARVGLTRTKENNMTQDTNYSWHDDAARYWTPHRTPAERRADIARLAERNSKEALRKLIYDTPPDDTPFVSSILPK